MDKRLRCGRQAAGEEEGTSDTHLRPGPRRSRCPWCGEKSCTHCRSVRRAAPPHAASGGCPADLRPIRHQPHNVCASAGFLLPCAAVVGRRCQGCSKCDHPPGVGCQNPRYGRRLVCNPYVAATTAAAGAGAGAGARCRRPRCGPPRPHPPCACVRPQLPKEQAVRQKARSHPRCERSDVGRRHSVERGRRCRPFHHRPQRNPSRSTRAASPYAGDQARESRGRRRPGRC